MTFEFFPRFSQNFSQLLDESDDYNVIIKAGEDPNTKEFHAHSNVLRSRSPYFKRALSQNWAAKENDMINFTKPNISCTVFEMIIKYIYTGVLDVREKGGQDIIDLLVAADELLIDELVTFSQKYLIENQTDWLKQNFIKVLHIVFQLESCKQIQDYCLESICDDPVSFFNSANVSTLEKHILLEIIKRDDLQIEEVELWKYLLKWGIAQTSELSEKDTNNLSNWNKENFLTLKNTLNPFISHIRFIEISSKDFHINVWPFKKVLPESLFEDIMSYYMAETLPTQSKLPPRHGKIDIDSIVVKAKHAGILANWIQRQDANLRIPKDKYKFNLVYRGSRDGFSNVTMRSKCNGQGACVIIIKINENGTIIGGYNPLGWRSNNHARIRAQYFWANTTESFIFSLNDGRDIKNIKISRVSSSNNAIYDSNINDITLNFGFSDLVINNQTGSCNQSNYESKILDVNNFSIEEMEIFSFTKIE